MNNLPPVEVEPNLLEPLPGTKEIRWTHEGVDLADMEYTVRGTQQGLGIEMFTRTFAGDEVTRTPAGSGADAPEVLSVTVETDEPCLEIFARTKDRTRSVKSVPACFRNG